MRSWPDATGNVTVSPGVFSKRKKVEKEREKEREWEKKIRKDSYKICLSHKSM